MRLENTLVPPTVMWVVLGGSACFGVIALIAAYWLSRRGRPDRPKYKRANLKSVQKTNGRKRRRK